MKSHIERLNSNNIVIKDTYKDSEGIKKRSSDGEYFDNINNGYKKKKEIYLNNKLIYKQNNYIKAIRFSSLLKKIDKNVECPNCGYNGSLSEFYDGCKYCGTDFNTNIRENNMLLQFVELFNSKLFKIIVILLAIIGTGISIYLNIDSIKEDYFQLVNFILLFVGLLLGSYLVCSIMLIPICFTRIVRNDFKLSKDIRDGNIDLGKILKCLNSELKHYYYTTDNDLIDFDIFKVQRVFDENVDHKQYININCVIRKYYLNGNNIRTKEEKVFVKLLKNKYMRLYNTHVVINCNNCGHSVDISKDECEFCHTKIPRIAYWIIEDVK